MPKHQPIIFSPFLLRRTGCFFSAVLIVLLMLVFAPVAHAQSLSDKLMHTMTKSMGADLQKLAPRDTPQTPAQNPKSTGFDFYVLSLSWSPSYCADNGNRSNARQQCGLNRGFGFIVHGLWPQNQRGFPESCAHTQASDLVPRDLVSAMQDIMPSAGLMRHQWRKHGTCAGLSQRDYFSTVRNAYQAVTIPPAFRNVSGPRMVDPQLVEKAFIAANPGLPADAIAVTCKRRRLEEVRICMDTGLKFRPCAEVDRNSCRSNSVTLLPTR